MRNLFQRKRPVIALDADGVLLDYNKAAALTWEKVFGQFPVVNDAKAYHFRNVYGIDLSDDAVYQRYYTEFGASAWKTMPAMPKAIEGCQMLHAMGYDLHVVSSMPVAHQADRVENFRALGMPIASVVATGRVESAGNPKLNALMALKPVAFVDDLLANFDGVHQAMHCALLHWDSVDNPNQEHEHALKASSHSDMLDFATYWSSHPMHHAIVREEHRLPGLLWRPIRA